MVGLSVQVSHRNGSPTNLSRLVRKEKKNTHQAVGLALAFAGSFCTVLGKYLPQCYIAWHGRQPQRTQTALTVCVARQEREQRAEV